MTEGEAFTAILRKLPGLVVMVEHCHVLMTPQQVDAEISASIKLAKAPLD